MALHAKSKVDIREPQDAGGTRALLRQAINELRYLERHDHVIVLGDFNSHYAAREILSWHGFYALSGMFRPFDHPSARTRRNTEHAPLFVIEPRNRAQSTIRLADSGSSGPQIVDFIAVDRQTSERVQSQVLVQIAGTSVWNANDARPAVGDHLPVQGELRL